MVTEVRRPPGARGMNIDAIRFDDVGLSVNELNHFASALAIRQMRTL